MTCSAFKILLSLHSQVSRRSIFCDTFLSFNFYPPTIASFLRLAKNRLFLLVIFVPIWLVFFTMVKTPSTLSSTNLTPAQLAKQAKQQRATQANEELAKLQSNKNFFVAKTFN